MRGVILVGALMSATALAGAPQRPDSGPAPSAGAAVQTDERLTMFANALEQSGVERSIGPSEEWTLFVPSDVALRNEGSAFLLEIVLLAEGNAERLGDVVGHHLLRGQRLDLGVQAESLVATSAAGTPLVIEPVGAGTRIDGHAIVVDRVDAGSGVIYVIDRILWPEYWDEDTLVERVPAVVVRNDPDGR